MAGMDIEITHEPSRLAAVVRRTVAMADLVPFYDSVYTDVVAALGAVGSGPAGPALAWLHHDGRADALDVAAGFQVEGLESGPLTPDVEVVEIPSGRAVAAEYQGPYDGLSDAWQQLDDRRKHEGLTARGDTVEVYLTEPTPDGDPALNRTRLIMMVD